MQETMKENNNTILMNTIRTGLSTFPAVIIVMTVMDLDIGTNAGLAITFAVTIVAMIVNLLMNKFIGIPGESNQGILWVDDSDPEITRWTLQYYGDPNELEPGSAIQFRVESSK